MNELETHVNRIVASIDASPARKLEIRRELLAHVRDALREEELRASNADDAMDTALNRLGDPHQLQKDIQASIPFSDVLFRAFHRAVLCLVFLLFVSLPHLLVATFDGQSAETGSSALFEFAASIRSEVAPLLVAQCLIAANVFLISLLHYWLSIRIASRPIAAAISSIVATGVVVLASGSLLSLLATGGLIQSWGFCVRWIWIAFTVSLVIPFVLPMARREMQRYQHWQQCSILASD